MPSALAAGLLIPPKSVSSLPDPSRASVRLSSPKFGSNGRFTFSRRPVLASPSARDLLPLGQLAADLRKLGLPARVARNTVGQADVRVRRDAGPKSAPAAVRHEAYSITVAPGGVEIASAGDAGAYYAVQTLRELVRVHGKSLPCCRIEDWPDFARRGVYEDCSRGKVPTLQTLKDLVERLAAWKINEFQLYVENVFTFERHPLIGRGYSPFTPGEMPALGDHCKLHHVRLVGSLASFGHMEKILRLKQYRHLAELPGWRGWAGGSTLCPVDPGSIRLVRELYEEFVPLFPERDFNICGDEPFELGQGRSKARAGRVGVGRVYLEFLLKLDNLCRSFGKRTNAWADIVLAHPELLKDLPRDIVMLNWDYNANSKRLARSVEIAGAGLPLMVCPGTSGWCTHGTRLQNAIENVRQAAREGVKHNAEGLLNTDWGDGGHRNPLGSSMHGFAHGAACSWNSRGVDDKTFTRTFCRQAFAPLGRRADDLADAIAKLGRSYNTVCDEYSNHCALYFTLVEPVQPDKKHRREIHRCKPAGLKQVSDDLGDERLWPATTGLEKFDALTIGDLSLAARMDAVSARRALAIQDIRAGKSPSSAKLKTLTADMREMTAEFTRQWQARNKPSRLKDNLRELDQARRELEIQR